MEPNLKMNQAVAERISKAMIAWGATRRKIPTYTNRRRKSKTHLIKFTYREYTTTIWITHHTAGFSANLQITIILFTMYQIPTTRKAC